MTVSPNASGRVLECRMTGVFTEEEMLKGTRVMKKMTDDLKGRRHIVVADMRGMKTVHPSIANHMGEAIGYSRARGCVLCVHVSDDTVQRLQARRIARQFSPNDDVTIEVTSMEEARKVAASYEKFLDDARFPDSIRGAIPV
jgi:hypothetical protein